MWRAFSFIVLLFLFQACVTQRRAGAMGDIDRGLSAAKIIQKHKVQGLKEKELRLVSTLNFDSRGRGKTAIANFILWRDQQLYTSVSVLGFSVAKGLMLPDSIMGYEKINKTYIRSDYGFFNHLMGIDFLSLSNVEKLLLGEWFLPEKETSDWQVKYGKDAYTLTFKSIINPISKKISENAAFDSGELKLNANFKLISLRLFKNQKSILEIDYDGQIFLGKQDISQTINIFTPEKDTRIILTHKKLEKYDGEKIDLEIPENYKPNTSFK